MAHESLSALDTIIVTSYDIMKTAQTKPLQAADEDEEMGLNIFDSRDLTAEH